MKFNWSTSMLCLTTLFVILPTNCLFHNIFGKNWFSLLFHSSIYSLLYWSVLIMLEVFFNTMASHQLTWRSRAMSDSHGMLYYLFWSRFPLSVILVTTMVQPEQHVAGSHTCLEMVCFSWLSHKCPTFRAWPNHGDLPPTNWRAGLQAKLSIPWTSLKIQLLLSTFHLVSTFKLNTICSQALVMITTNR